MISPEEMTATADRLTDALTAAAAIMPPDEAHALSTPVPGRPASPASRPVRRRMGRLRAWLVPVGVAASVTAIILTAVTLSGHPGTVPAPRTGPAQAPASAGPGITSLAGVPSDPGTRTPPPPFYVTIVSMGPSRETAQVRRTSDGQVTGTVPALPAGWTLGRSISVTADDRTFTVAAATITACPSSTAAQTRFYQFNVTSTGHVTGLRAVGKPVTGEAVSEFAASPDGTEVAYAQQGCAAPLSAASYAGVIHVMNLTSGAVRSWHNTASAATPARVTIQIGALSWTADGRTLVADYLWKLTEFECRPGRPWPGRDQLRRFTASSQPPAVQPGRPLRRLRVHRGHQLRRIHPDRSSGRLLCRRSRAAPGCPGTACGCCSSPWLTGQPSRILYRSAASNGSYDDGGLVPVLSADGQAQHWLLWNDPEQFGWISGGKLIPLPKAPAGVLAINW